MYSQAISSKPRTVIKGKMCLSSVKLSIQMPFFSFTVGVYWLPLGSTLLTQFCYKCILRHYLFVYGGFSWCLFSFQDGRLKTNSKTRRNKITFNWFENINRGGGISFYRLWNPLYVLIWNSHELSDGCTKRYALGTKVERKSFTFACQNGS